MPKQLSELEAAIEWLNSHGLPLEGFVCLFNDKPFQWQSNRPGPQSVVPGAVAIDITTQERFVACGGNADGGALQWRKQKAHR